METKEKIFAELIAKATGINVQQVANVMELLDEGCTIPFISRYRKEKTGNMDEVRVEEVSSMLEKLRETDKRKTTILTTIEEQGKMTDGLRRRIEECWDNTVLEDIYLPFKPKRKTRAAMAKEKGLEPLANILLLQRERNPEQAAQRFLSDKVESVEAALQGGKGHNSRECERERAEPQHRAWRVPPRGCHYVEGGEGKKGH